ncbi:MAG: hypothetical protein M1828_007081 [Chrysothrix sp. TS-e1954]|nr:MAG: hypothetical protein M1828_007081 [Chrysothrix sp. TS-e1954]
MVRQDATPVAISRIEFRTTIRTGLIPLLLGPNPAYTVHLRYLSVPLFDCEANSWALREFYDNVDDKVVTDQREAFDASLKQHVKYPLEVLTMTLTDRHVTTDRRHLGDRMTMAVHSFFQRWQQISGPKTLILRFTTVLERGFCHVGFRDFGKRLKRAKIPDSIISIHWRDWAVRSPESELFGMALERHGSCGSELVLKVSMSATTEQKQAVLNIRRKSEWFWAASNIHGEDTDLDDGTDSMRSTSDSESEDFD